MIFKKNKNFEKHSVNKHNLRFRLFAVKFSFKK
jgi:hypothetical protein